MDLRDSAMSSRHAATEAKASATMLRLGGIGASMGNRVVFEGTARSMVEGSVTWMLDMSWE